MALPEALGDCTLVDGCPHDIIYIAPTPIDLDGLYLQVNRAGITSETNDNFHIVRGDTYRYCLIHCVTHGRGTVTVRGRTYPVREGQVFVLGAHEAHDYASDPGFPLALTWVEFGGGSSSQLVSHILDLGGPIYDRGVFKEVMDLCTAILYHPTRRNPKVSGILYDVLMLLCSAIEDSTRHSEAHLEVLKYIDDNLNRQLTLTEVAKKYGYHPSYFSTLFSKTMGMTFSKYVMARRMSHACYLLMATQWSVERIARELGFYDVSHFISRFRATEGITPSRFRKESASFPKAKKEP